MKASHYRMRHPMYDKPVMENQQMPLPRPPLTLNQAKPSESKSAPSCPADETRAVLIES
jgi:hypothetical protein